ncbi:MAG: hypothetical protein PHN69_03510 [Candidatus Pacebacteria bacterium]|nr:hypothetical protein [Fermentimonas sp.]MDD4804217.1 hypothetical protein [Candidatus Paceibacterota bacterium]
MGLSFGKIKAVAIAFLLLVACIAGPVFAVGNTTRAIDSMQPTITKTVKTANAADATSNLIVANHSTKKLTTNEKTDYNDGVTALDSLNPLNMGKKMVGEGGIYFLELLGDAGFKVGTNNTDTVSVKQNYGNAVALIYTLATLEFDPSDNEFVKDIQLRFAIIGFFLILMFIILGAVNVNIYTITSAKNAEKAWILNNRYHIPINEYALTLIEACVMMTAGYVVLRLTIIMELMFTKLIMFQVLDRIVPTGDNIIMYLMMSICYLLIGIAIAYRIIVISLFHASYIAWIGLYCFGITRPAAVSAWWYYLKILFMRTVIVGVTVIGVGMISYIKLPRDTGMNRVLGDLLIVFIHPILYAALILILVIICIIFIVGIKNVMTTSKYAIKRYTYGAYKP